MEAGLKALLIALLFLMISSGVGHAQESSTEETPTIDAPEGVEILLPRGGIPAIFEPEFVPASESVLPEDEWVFGVAYAGEARAYSLTLLNHHEIVNDQFGDHPLAAVW